MAYRLTEAVPVDLFPDTPHFELVMKFERDTRKKRSDDVNAKEDPAEDNSECSTSVDDQKEDNKCCTQKGLYYTQGNS